MKVLDQADPSQGTMDSDTLVVSTDELAVPTATVGLDAGQSRPVTAVHSDDELSQLSDVARSQIGNLRGRARRLMDALRSSRQQQEELELQVQARLEAQRETEARLTELSAAARDEGERSQESQATLERLRRQVAELSTELTTQKEQKQALTVQLDFAQSRKAALKFGSDSDDADSETPSAALGATERDSAGPPHDAPDEDALAAIARLRETSVWSDAARTESVGDRQRPTDSPAEARSSASFIEQFAPHLLDDADESETSAGRSMPNSLKTALAADYAVSSSDDAMESSAAAAVAPTRGADGRQEALPQGEDDESLEEYMAKLMKRVRGSDASETTRPMSPTPQNLAPVPVVKDMIKEPLDKTQSQESSAFRLEDIKRAAPPERGGNFAAMRELANQSAHGAISNYRTARGTRDSVRCLLASGICLACGVGTFFMAPELMSPAGVGAAAAILAAAYFAIGGIWSLSTLVRGGNTIRRRLDENADPNDERNSSPVSEVAPDEEICQQAGSATIDRP